MFKSLDGRRLRYFLEETESTDLTYSNLNWRVPTIEQSNWEKHKGKIIGATIGIFVGIVLLPFALAAAAAPVAGGAAVAGAHTAGLLAGTLTTAQTISVGGSVATATLITGGATAIGGALGTLLGSKFDDCETDEERLAVILEEISRRETELRENAQDIQTRTNFKEVVKLGIKFAL